MVQASQERHRARGGRNAAKRSLMIGTEPIWINDLNMLFTCRRLVAAVLLKALSGCRTGETPGQEDHGDVVVTYSAGYSDDMLLVNNFLGQQ